MMATVEQRNHAKSFLKKAEEYLGSAEDNLTAELGDGSRSRGLAALGILFPLKALLALPHLIVVELLTTVAAFLAWIGYWVVAFTGALPDAFFEVPLRILDWQARITGWIASAKTTGAPFFFRNFSWASAFVEVRSPTSTNKPAARAKSAR